MRRVVRRLSGGLIALSVLLYLVAMGSERAQAAPILFTGGPEVDILDNEFLPLLSDEFGSYDRVFRNMTGETVVTLRLAFLTQLSTTPDARGGDVITATVDEVTYTNLSILDGARFRIRTQNLLPFSRFAAAVNNDAVLSRETIENLAVIYEELPAPIPLPLPALMLGAGLVALRVVTLRRRGPAHTLSHNSA